ncbi:hypothetical protein C8T65DRAFT_699663 [Cerioporus squamosus]|nr:hypothetical protein C8T65DRAFT_699663 [Cerioporus squamosus]
MPLSGRPSRMKASASARRRFRSRDSIPSITGTYQLDRFLSPWVMNCVFSNSGYGSGLQLQYKILFSIISLRHRIIGKNHVIVLIIVVIFIISSFANIYVHIILFIRPGWGHFLGADRLLSIRRR